MPHDYYISPEDYEIAKKRGISNSTLYARVYRLRWSKQRAMTEPVRKRREIGSHYRRQAIKNDIPITTYDSRIRRGWCPKRASTEPVKSKEERIDIMKENNRRYPEWVHDNLKKHNINYITFYTRMNNSKRKWTLEEASTKPPIKKKPSTKGHVWNTYIKNDVERIENNEVLRKRRV